MIEIFYPRNVQEFDAPKAFFESRAFGFLVSHEWKDTEEENIPGFGT